MKNLVLFNKDISNEIDNLNGLNVKKNYLEDMLDNLEDIRIPNENFESYITSKKYNL